MSTNVGSKYSKYFFKISNVLAQKGKIMTDQEFRLLSYYTSFPSSWTFRVEKLTVDLDWSESKVKRTRLTLQENGYLLIRRLPKNEFIYYIGKPAVKAYLLDKAKKENTSLSDDEEAILKKTEVEDDKLIFEDTPENT